MRSEEDEDDGGGIPEWVVTFGDMMSLLLTFFIMLVSMSEIKQEERFQALVDSMRRRFGHDLTRASLVPGQNQVRTSALRKMATMGRARRADIMRGGDKVRAPVGENPQVRIIRPGDDRTIGGMIHFDEGSAELSEENKRHLQITAQEIGGKPQKIEIRGHTTPKPAALKSPAQNAPSHYRDNWDLAYTRCHRTMEFLIGIGIERTRIRISVAADNEPVYTGTEPIELMKNSRVEVFMLNEQVQDLNKQEDEIFAR